MNLIERNRQPLIFLAAAVVICGLSYLLLYHHAPDPAPVGVDAVKTGEPEFKESLHLTSIKADSFTALLSRVYSTAGIQRSKGKMQVSLSGQGARASDFYNDNPYLLKVSSDEFSIRHDKAKDEIAAIFTLHTEGGETFIRVPNDILFQLTEKATNAQHG